MGAVMDVILWTYETISSFNDVYCLEFNPFWTFNPAHFGPAGWNRKIANQRWEELTGHMLTYELGLRRSFLPLIHDRVCYIQNSIKFSLRYLTMAELMTEFPTWPVQKILDLHDLFDAFDSKRHELVSVKQMCQSLDCLGDVTDYVARTALLFSITDECRYIHYHKFLKMYEFFEANCGKNHGVVKALKRGIFIIRMLQHGSAPQLYLNSFC